MTPSAEAASAGEPAEADHERAAALRYHPALDGMGGRRVLRAQLDVRVISSPASMLARSLSQAPFVQIGRISFGLYL